MSPLANLEPTMGDSPRAVKITQDDSKVISLTERKVEDTEFVSTMGFDRSDEPVVSRKELWSYYLYYNGNNGGTIPFGFSLTLFQSLAYSAGFDPSKGPGNPCDPTGTGNCVVPWGSGKKPVSSVVLIANSVSFAIMTLIFTTFGSAADYGTFGRWFLLVSTILFWGASYAHMALTTPSRWPVAMALYMFVFVAFGATIVFYTAVFPRLARNTSRTRTIRAKYETGEISKDDFELQESLEKNRISNVSTAHSNIGFVVVMCLNLAILLPLENDPKANNYVIVFVNSYYVLLGIWWFIFQESRPGPPLPKGEHYLTIGWKLIWKACKEYKKLPYTFIYLIAVFLLADGFNTTLTLVVICQNNLVSFSFLQSTYLWLSMAIASMLSTFGFWYFQKYFKVRTKKMFIVTTIFAILIPFWGMIGIWTEKFGFHNMWEFWAYNVIYGLFQAPYFAFAQTMMAELTPPGFDYMFFGLFGFSNRASSIIGPNVIQAIINQFGNIWLGFAFLFANCMAASLIIWFCVDVEKGRRDAIAWAQDNKKD